MGGDFAPEVTIEGAIAALKLIDKDSRIVLYGDEKRMRELLAKHNCSADNFDIVPQPRLSRWATTLQRPSSQRPIRASP